MTKLSAETEGGLSAERTDGLPEETVRTVEALLFAAHEPLLPSTLAPALNGTARSTLDRVMAEINFRLGEGGHPMRVRKVAGGYQMHVLPQYGPAIEAALVKTRIQRLSRAGLETLAIIAYKQPCSTPEMELIRGVSCSGVLSTLLERNLITICGRSEGPGRPLLYGTTPGFLEYFGLSSLDDLPRIEELEEILSRRDPANAPTVFAESPGRDAVAGSTRLVLNRPSEPDDGRFRITGVVAAAPDGASHDNPWADSVEGEDTISPAVHPERFSGDHETDVEAVSVVS